MEYSTMTEIQTMHSEDDPNVYVMEGGANMREVPKVRYT
jgi:hypothetical protein